MSFINMENEKYMKLNLKGGGALRSFRSMGIMYLYCNTPVKLLIVLC